MLQINRATRIAAGFLVTLACIVSGNQSQAEAADVWDEVEHHYAANGDTKIHYTTIGEGEPVVFVHGFPDFWYSWRHQMATLAPHFKAVAIDTRGYNQSDQPVGVEHYAMENLLADVNAVIDDLGVEQVNLVGHDWGGAIAWQFTMANQDRVKRLIILNLTHPRGYSAVVANPSPEQAENVQYAKNFASSEPKGDPIPERLLGMGESSGDPKVAKRYREAFEQSYWDGMMNYYRANYRSLAERAESAADAPDITCPVLQFHGLKDTAVDKDGLRDTWNWITNDYTLVTVPSAGHFVQWEAAELVSDTMKWWLLARQ
jgi:pimeloyl-ACP methyl ester carboxylesterase